jgi:hypothetical protein
MKPADLIFPAHIASGNYRSLDEVGPLGHLRLNLIRRAETETVYDATLSGEASSDFGESEGVGTLGNEHLILNFDRGLESDFYFQGNIVLSGEAVNSINGTFVFPDQAEQLAVEFAYAGPAIEAPAE